MFLTERWSETTLVAVDVEGNGGHPQELIEVAVVRINEGKVQSVPRTWLVRPSRPVSRQAQRIHGISNEDLQGAPAISEVADEILTELGNYPVIGHQVAIDFRLLEASIPMWAPSAVLDTLRLAKSIVPAPHPHSLTALVDLLALRERIEGRPHRAGYDAAAAAHIFVRLAQTIDPDEKLTVGDLVRRWGIDMHRGSLLHQESLF
jgi:exodeoxyribonuclease X